MSVTIKDIAKVLKVSPMAVSKALNDRPDVSSDLKRKVKKVALELGYRPNSIARRLVTKKSNTLGVFLLTRYKLENDDNYGYKFFDGIIEEANNREYDIVLFSVDSDTFENVSYLELCFERQVEGAIFIGLGIDDKYISDLVSSKLPIALIDSFQEGENISVISSNNEEAVIEVMDYLWSLGHRQIALLKGHDQAFVVEKRSNAYRKFLEEKNSYNDEIIFQGDFTVAGGYQAAKQLINLKNRPTALFCESDTMAIGALKAFKDAGIKVPEDISIVGFDNINMSEYVSPALTTVTQSPVQMGRVAAKTVIDMIEKGEKSQNHIIDCLFIKRESCAEVILK